MTQPKHYNRQLARHEMNLALDGMLTDKEQSSLKAHLAESSADAKTWSNLQTVDRILSVEPMISAPSNFAAGIMAQIAAGKVTAEGHPYAVPPPRTDLRTVIGMLFATIAMMPVAFVVMLFVQRLLTNPVEQQLLLQRITWLVNVFAQAITLLLQVVAQNAWAIGITAGLAALVTSFTTIRITLSRMSRRNMVVYRIPVVAA
jgi:anti-sigma factor RsiW